MREHADKSCPNRFRAVGAILLLALATAVLASASCVTELNKIVRTAEGRVKGVGGETIANAQVKVISSVGYTVFQTKSGEGGSFSLATNPGKYRVEVEAEGYLRLSYIVDLRSAVVEEPFDLPLQSISQCHDMGTTSEQDKTETNCNSEEVSPNLTLRRVTVIKGLVRDESGAPLKGSKIVLAKKSAIPLQPGYLESTTDELGKFGFDEAEPGEYRLLASSSRAFAQPANLECYEKQDCNLEITLKVNSTDLPYSDCPVR